MTEAEHAAIEIQLLGLRKPWLKAAETAVRGKVADARAHAARAVTDTLKATPDGRPTVRQALRSPSLQAAQHRLDELRVTLAGASTDSLAGVLRDAREAFYHDAFTLWAPHLDPAVHQTGKGPTTAGAKIARGAVIHGYDLHAELEGVFGQAGRSLVVAVNTAGARAAPRSLAADRLGVWASQTADAITRRCRTVLEDSQRALFWSVEQALVKPELISD